MLMYGKTNTTEMSEFTSLNKKTSESLAICVFFNIKLFILIGG